jgi:hypothetical protein
VNGSDALWLQVQRNAHWLDKSTQVYKYIKLCVLLIQISLEYSFILYEAPYGSLLHVKNA